MSKKAQKTSNQLTDLQQQIADLTQALQRERADATNLRRRHEAELASLRSRVRASVVHELLPVIDNLERALKYAPPELANNEYVKGVQGVVKQFEKMLVDIGVERIKTVGEHFDPQLHEAVALEHASSKHQVVSEELQAGYRLGDEIIRHAMVKVKG